MPKGSKKAKKSLRVLTNLVRRKRGDEGTVIWTFDGDTFECYMAWRNKVGERVCRRIAEATARVLEEGLE